MTEKSHSSKQFQVGESRSLAKLANDRNDLIGLIAYGIYKFEQSEWARSSKPTPEEVGKHSATLQETRIQSLRSNAELRLSLFVQSNENQWRQELYDEIRRQVFDDVSTQFDTAIAARFEALRAEVRASTGFWRSIATNVVAWFITLAITAIVLASYFSPSFTIMPKG